MYKFYLKKLLENELGYRNGVPTTGKTFLVSKNAANENFPPLGVNTKNDNVKIKLSNKLKQQFHEVTYTYHNDKFFGGTRNEFRIYLTNELLTDFRTFEPDDIVIFISKSDRFHFEMLHFKPIDKDYKSYNQLLEDSNHIITNYIDNELINDSEVNKKISLNTILFGPPGTGKTDATVEKALEILDLKTDDRTENREIFRSLLNKKIFFVTMHPSYGYEDFVQGIKPKISIDGTLLFENKPGVFKHVSDLAKKIFEDEGEVIDNEIDNKDILRLCFFLSKFNSKADKKANKYFGSESNGEVFAIVGNRFGTNPNSIKNHRDKFDFLTTEERKGWRPHNGSSDKLDNTPLWPYHDIYLELNPKTFEEVQTLVKSIEKKREIEVKRTEDNTNYVLILDEINRANISKVFGELITLLEEDKRIGKENELSVTLPSGEIFSVPPNLYIIGTMNTADKSIALVDIALRRRFQFLPIYPNSEIVEDFGKKEKDEKKKLMEDLNKLLIDSKSKYYKGVDFQIGHAYFLKDNSLGDVINENVIPLLTEYFRNDLEKIRSLMSDIGKALDEEYYKQTGLLKYIG